MLLTACKQGRFIKYTSVPIVGINKAMAEGAGGGTDTDGNLISANKIGAFWQSH